MLSEYDVNLMEDHVDEVMDSGGQVKPVEPVKQKRTRKVKAEGGESGGGVKAESAMFVYVLINKSQKTATIAPSADEGSVKRLIGEYLQSPQEYWLIKGADWEPEFKL